MAAGNLKWEAGPVEGVWIGEAREPGPTVAVIGGVHGDELTGIEVVKESRSKLAIDCGRVVLMLGNLPAIERNQRDTGTNLNRQFKPLTLEQVVNCETEPYEVHRAQELLPFLRMCDAALDLHDYTSPKGRPFIVCERNALTTALKIGAPVVSFGWSQTEVGATDGYMYSLGREGLCYEIGQKDLPRENLERGHGVVARFLSAQKLVEATYEPLFTDPLFVQAANAFLRTSEDYALAEEFVTFQTLEPGQLIARLGGTHIYADEGEVIIFPEATPPIGREAFSIGHVVTA